MEKIITGIIISLSVLVISLFLINTVAEVTEPEQDTVFHSIWSQIVSNAKIVFILLLIAIPVGFGLLIHSL